MITRKVLVLMLLIFPCIFLYSQTNKEVYDYITSIEDSEISDEKKQVIIEDLYYLSINPININNADENTLRLIGLNDFQILSLKLYIKETHPLLSIYEIPLINGFSQEVLKQIQPFIYVAPLKWKPSLRADSIFSKAVHDIRLQYKKMLESSWGYIREDNKGYIGDNYSTSVRYNFNYYDRLSFSFVADKDAGEPFFNKYQKCGYDFISAQFTLRNISIIEQLTLGDYRLGFAQGLAMNQNLNFGYFSNDGKSMKNYNGIKPNRSLTEYDYMRGIGAKLRLKDLSIYLFGSYNNIDYSGSILTTGLHRTYSELSKKDSNTELVYGTHISWQRKGFEIGSTFFAYQYKYPITHQNSAYMKYYFEGLNNNVMSINGAIPLFRRAKLYGELAMSKNKAMAAIVGAEINLGYKSNLSLVFRDYSNKYQNYFSSAIGVQNNNANEKGLYAAFSHRYNDRLSFFIGGDYFRFPEISYRANTSVRGYKVKAEIIYKVKKEHPIALIYKLGNRPYNETHLNGDIYPEDNIQNQVQLRYQGALTNWLNISTRIGYSLTRTYKSDTNDGVFISQDIIIKPTPIPLSFNFRFALFDTDDFDNCFYVYEYGLPLNFYTSGLYDKGLRTYAILKYDITKSMYLCAKYSLTYYFRKEYISSGNDKIESKHKQELAFGFYLIIGKYKNKIWA